MPPLPRTIASLVTNPNTFPVDCIAKNDLADPQYQDPFALGLPPNDFDNQRYDQQGSVATQNNDKRLLAKSIFHYRAVSFIGGPTLGEIGGPGHSSLEDVVGAFNYWESIPWGAVGFFFDNRDFGKSGFGTDFGNYTLDPAGGPPTPQTGIGGGFIDIPPGYFLASTQWNQIGALLQDERAPATYIRTSGAIQFMNPPPFVFDVRYGLIEYGGSGTPFGLTSTDLLGVLNYEIWRVTGRWSWRSGTGLLDDDGYPVPNPGISFPNPPWASSSDFTKIGSGSLKPGQIVTVGAYDMNPIGDCQTPPAPDNLNPTTGYGVGSYSDWDGWGVGVYLAFV